MQENAVSVREIPFPAVTICPGLSIDYKDLDYEAIATSVKNGETRIEELPMKM